MQKAGIPVTRYYASEIDKNAIRLTQHNYPATVQLGDVRHVRCEDIPEAQIDLLMGGSPCQ